ncbi:MAG: hypothetical protein IJ083_14630 [Clostridia bacterium]|nr:hypothetical protein [Clostridia bacterium]
MDGFAVWIILLIIWSVVGASRKNKGKKTSHAPKGAPLQPPRPITPVVPADDIPQPSVSHMMEDEEHLALEREGAPLAPAASVSVRISPHHHEGMFDGSMAASPMDPGHLRDDMPSEHSEEFFVEDASSENASADGSALHLRWDAGSLMQAVVMQEVLNRSGPLSRSVPRR